mmetsp:Transcript_1051/g.2429  ORF Transcript_1051/g.2429 Transcript_1051/m.2429 type:complete len:106 (-) Transcript_1051:235-552(-)
MLHVRRDDNIRTSLRAAPQRNACFVQDGVAEVVDGELVRVLQASEGWALIACANGIGYIQSAHLTEPNTLRSRAGRLAKTFTGEAEEEDESDCSMSSGEETSDDT